jgi:hypothetical protein
MSAPDCKKGALESMFDWYVPQFLTPNDPCLGASLVVVHALLVKQRLDSLYKSSSRNLYANLKSAFLRFILEIMSVAIRKRGFRGVM